MKGYSLAKELVWLLCVAILITALVLIGVHGNAWINSAMKREIARKIPVEYNPSLKLSCHLSGYTSSDCDKLYDNFCFDTSYWGTECSDPRLNVEYFRFLDTIDQPVSVRYAIVRNQRDLLRVITTEEESLGLAQVSAPSVNLSSAPVLQAELAKTSEANHIFNAARSGRIQYYSIWASYRNTTFALTDIQSGLQQHVRARAILSLCSDPAFVHRIPANPSLYKMCSSGVVTDHLYCTNIRQVRDFFWYKLMDRPRPNMHDHNLVASIIPSEFWMVGSQNYGSVHLAIVFADAMEVAPLDRVDSESYAAQMDRLYRAVALADSVRARGLLRMAQSRSQGTRSAEEVLDYARRNHARAITMRFWPRFYAASTIEDMVAVVGDLLG